jgi:hypothetical protein
MWRIAGRSDIQLCAVDCGEWLVLAGEVLSMENELHH